MRSRAVAGLLRMGLGVVASLLLSATLSAAEFPLPPTEVGLVGSQRTATVVGEDTLLDIARRNEVGQTAILLANPTVDRWLPGVGTEVLLPTRYILPDAPRRGIVLNIPEMRLYFYDKGYAKGRGSTLPTVTTYPVSIGRMDWQTPLGETRIVARTRNPSWRPPESVKLEALADGKELPDVVPAGPDNPLGSRALRLGLPGYLIHGTNRPFGIGMEVTHGCVRMDPEAIEALFDRVRVGSRVTIVDQPIKAGWSADTLFVEVHPPLEPDDPDRPLMFDALKVVGAALKGRLIEVDMAVLERAVLERSGIPVAISSPEEDEEWRELRPGAAAMF